MWEQIFQTASSTGLWAMLFVALFFIQIKDSKTREEKYQKTISDLADKLKIVSDIHEAVEEIKDKIK